MDQGCAYGQIPVMMTFDGDRLGVQPLSLMEMLETADAVSMQTVYASRYCGLVNDRILASCRPGQLWASVSRASAGSMTSRTSPFLTVCVSVTRTSLIVPLISGVTCAISTAA